MALAVPAFLFMAINAAPPGRRGFALSRAQILLLLLGVAAVAGLGLLITSGFQIDTVQRLLKVLDQADATPPQPAPSGGGMALLSFAMRWRSGNRPAAVAT